MARALLVLQTAALLTIPASAQTVFEVSSEPAMPQYELITLVAVAPFGYVEGGDAPFRYRAVVEAFEVYHHLYIEKLAISNSEGVADGVARSRRIALERLLDRLGYLPDEQSVKEVRWESPVALSFTLAETKLLIRDVREEPLRVEMKTE